MLNAETFVIEAAASSRDIRLERALICRSESSLPAALSILSPPALVFANTQAEPALNELLVSRLSISTSEASALLSNLKGSFLGFYDTLSWYIGDAIPEADVVEVFDKLNSKVQQHNEQKQNILCPFADVSHLV